MRYFIPTEVYSEQDCVKKHGADVARYGKKCLIVTGKHSAKVNGAYEDVMTVLKEQGIASVLFDRIEENPSIETVMEARALGVKEQVEFVIGIGGGSPLDASKAIAMMIANPDVDESVLYQAVPLAAIPVVAVPTTAGTGSEVTPYAILTIHKEKTKRSIAHKIFPALALADAKYLRFASRSILVNTAVDALAHLIESNLNSKANEYNRIFSERGMQVWARAKEGLVTDNLSDADYENLMLASTIAGMSISHTGTSLPHGLSYAVTYHYGTPHGKAVGIFLPGYLQLCEEQEPAAVKRVLALLECDTVEEFGTLIHTLIGDVEIEEALWEGNVTGIMNNPAKLANYPYTITKEQLYQIH